MKLHPDNSLTFSAIITNEGEAVNDATVSVKVTDLADADVMASTAMGYVAGSSGLYTVTVSPIVGVTAGTTYKIIMSATSGGGLVGEWTQEVASTTRGCE